jgi:hypothetical protein
MLFGESRHHAKRHAKFYAIVVDDSGVTAAFRDFFLASSLSQIGFRSQSSAGQAQSSAGLTTYRGPDLNAFNVLIATDAPGQSINSFRDRFGPDGIVERYGNSPGVS